MVRPLIGLLLASALLLGADDPAQILRIAWASQYEWREDGIENVTLEFKYRAVWGTEPEIRGEGAGQVVVVGNDIVRRHYPDARTPAVRNELDTHVGWVLRRFVRRPFEEAFQGLTIAGPEPAAYDRLKITVNDRALYVKAGRLAAMDVDEGVPGRPLMTLVEFTTDKLGGGYAIVGEQGGYTRASDSVRVEKQRTLTTKLEKDIPAPAIYTFQQKAGKERIDLTIEFHSLRFNLADPVTLDPAARDLLKAAWEARYVLPDDIKLQGEFTRRVDRDLDRAGWLDDVRGEFQIWGIDRLQIAVDPQVAGRRWGGEVHSTCSEHIRWIFDLLRRTPFEEEFKGCGFELLPEGKEKVVRVYGYAKALAFKVVDGALVGHFDKVLSDEGWWEYKTKRQSDGRNLLERMRREVEGTRYDLEFRYQRLRGEHIPKKMDALGVPASGTTIGVAEYSFRKVRLK